jgi:hypothetical protein
MKKLIDFIFKFGKFKYAFSFILIGIVVQIFIFSSFLPDFLIYSGGIKNPDQLFWYNYEYINNLYQKLGVNGLNAYASMLYIDFVYLSISALGYSLLLSTLVKKRVWFITIPMFMAFFDIGENLSQLVLMNQYPSISSIGVQISSLFTSLKMVSAIIGVLLILFFVLRNIVIWVNKKRKKQEL